MHSSQWRWLRRCEQKQNDPNFRLHRKFDAFTQARAGHVAWGKPPWPPEVAKDVTRVEGSPGDAILFSTSSCMTADDDAGTSTVAWLLRACDVAAS